MDQRFQLSLDTSPVGEMISMSEEELKQATEPSTIGKIPLVNDFVEGGYFFYQNKIKGKGWDEYQYSPISNNLVSPREQKDKSFMTFMEIAGGFIGASQATHTHGSLRKAFQNTGNKLKNLPNAIRNLPNAIKNIFSKNKFGDLDYAAEYGIDTYKNLAKKLKGTDLQAHHILEKRFADALGIADSKLMSSVAVTKAEHQIFTNAWRQAIPYGTNYGSLSKDFIWSTAQDIYKSSPALLKAIQGTLF